VTEDWLEDEPNGGGAHMDDVCRHGVGFDEECEQCGDEEELDRIDDWREEE
jgi:hypothetical protein